MFYHNIMFNDEVYLTLVRVYLKSRTLSKYFFTVTHHNVGAKQCTTNMIYCDRYLLVNTVHNIYSLELRFTNMFLASRFRQSN